MDKARKCLAVALLFGAVGCSGNDSFSSFFTGPAGLEPGAPFGAIAFSKSSQRWQVVSDLPSIPVARARALSGCQTSDCMILLEFSRGECASLSLDTANVVTKPYVVSSKDPDSAHRMAKNTCASDGGIDCKASPAVCN